MHAALAGKAGLIGGHARAVRIGVDAGKILEDGKMAQPQTARDRHGEEEIAALAAGDEIHIHAARGLAHQVDELMIDRAGGKLLFNFAVNLAVERQLVARAGLLDDGKQRVGRGLAAVEELRVDVERAELAGCIPERLTFGADAHGVGFKQPRYDRVIHGFASLAVFVFCYYKGWHAKREERREICADKKMDAGLCSRGCKNEGDGARRGFFAAQFAGGASG